MSVQVLPAETDKVSEMLSADYEAFLSSKRIAVPDAGINAELASINPLLFDFQRALTLWALRKGRAALFADTGLGKTFMQCEWGRLIGGRCLIVAPLGVVQQTIREAARLGIEIRYARSQADVSGQIAITNYEMVHHFDPACWDAVILDESSILKSLDGKTRLRLTEMFAGVPHRLCCTATPAPNDIAEIANHAEFLGVMRRVDMLATFFVHDDAGWRLKGHARADFYCWLASWSMAVRTPSDLGFPDDGYLLPPLSIEPVWVDVEVQSEGKLFFAGLKGVGDRAAIRRQTIGARVQSCVDLVNAEPDEAWVIWCGLNDEQDALARAFGDRAFSVYGTLSTEEKWARIGGWLNGERPILISKPSIAGFGLNMQHCARMAFVGLSDSFESYYQCIRRCYRFGQTRPVHVSIILAQVEDAIYQNVIRKEREAREMSEQLVAQVRDYEREEIEHAAQGIDTAEQGEAQGKNWRLLLGDSVERLREIPDASVHLSVFSPPFMSLYTYSPTPRDVGNCTTEDAFFAHFGYIIQELLRVTIPGRNCCVHVAQVPAMLERDGYIGLKDFRGKTIDAFMAHGWVFHGEVCIDKDPQAQAIRTKSKALLFTQFRKDASWSRPALADYILIFRKPGENKTPIHPELTNEQWIEFARPIWYGISESDTLQYQAAREAQDERHICPLQLGTIARCISLWSNKGETVLDPFAGIGSTPHEATRLGRRGLGIELKRSYWQAAVSNLRRVEREIAQPTLFDGLGEAKQ